MPVDSQSVIRKIFDGNFLSERKKTILRLRMQGKTLAAIGQQFNLSRERIRQLGQQINRALIRNLTQEELHAYRTLRMSQYDHQRIQ